MGRTLIRAACEILIKRRDLNLETKAKPKLDGKMIIMGIQHVFAMFGATVIVPIATGLSPAVALFCAGAGTWLFHLITKRKVPVFLGSSFAFIAAINTAAAMNGGDLAYATGGIVCAGAVYLIFALLVKIFGVEKVKSFFPPVVTGPMIIIIGLMLAPTAVSSITTPIGGIATGINWLVAGVTILTIIAVTLFAKGFFKLVPILFGIVVGYLASLCFGMVDVSSIAQASFFASPDFFLPKFNLTSILLVAPIAIVTFVEHVGDITANGAVTGNNFMVDPGLHRTLIGDGVATMLAGFLGGPANTTYSENTGVLAATKNYNPITLRIAATFAILISFFGKICEAIRGIPGPVLGGVSVVLYGMIAAVGLKTLVENKVDFNQSRNLLIVSIMLVMGLGGATIQCSELVSISGTALAAILGIVLNKVLPERVEE